tara:strand:- start:1686 stop:2036 length:351 start_codon:yes stop_codon:yes gene_type:complete
VEMMMREDAKTRVITSVIEITEVVMTVTRTHEPVHMEAAHVDNHTGTISYYGSANNNRSEQHAARCHLIIPVPIDEHMAAGSPHPMRRDINIIRAITNPVAGTPAIASATIDPDSW